MRVKPILFILLAMATTTSGCATVTRGSSDQVAFSSSPAGVRVTTSLGPSCVTPCQMTIMRKQPFAATFQHGKQKRVVNVKSVTSSSGVAAGAGNILVGGVVGIAVDAGTGANRDHFPNPVHVDFNQPAAQAQTLAEAHAKKAKQTKRSASSEGRTSKKEAVPGTYKSEY